MSLHIFVFQGRISHIGTFEELTNNKVNALIKELGQKDSEKEKVKEDNEMDRTIEADDNVSCIVKKYLNEMN